MLVIQTNIFDFNFINANAAVTTACVSRGRAAAQRADSRCRIFVRRFIKTDNIIPQHVKFNGAATPVRKGCWKREHVDEKTIPHGYFVIIVAYTLYSRNILKAERQ